MLISRIVAGVLSVGIVAAGTETVFGQNYPTKPVRIVTTAAGSGNDIVARIMAPGLTARLGQQIIVDNRGFRAGEIVAKAPPDGYTLLSYGPSLWLMTLLRNNVPYDPVKDFSPITLSVSTPNIVVVNMSSPVKSVAELIAVAKARPGELNYAAAEVGSSTHLAAELFKAMARVDLTLIPFHGSAPALTAVAGGQVQIMFPNAGAATPYLKSGRVRALAVTSAKPSALAPGLPTVAASGLPGYESTSPFAIFAPPKAPAKLINLLNQEIVRILVAQETKDKLFHSGMEVAASSPQELADFILADIAKFGKVIRDAGIKE